MSSTPSHPLAEHPLDALRGRLECSLPAWHRMYLAMLLLESSLRQCAPLVSGTVLDVGCGRRPYEKTFFAGATRYVGTDYLSDRSNPEVISSALRLPFKDAAFDTVTSTEMLEHVPEPLAGLREMRRVLKPRGHLILSAPMCWPRHEQPYDFYRYPYDGMLYLIRESGLELTRLFNRGRSYAFLGQMLQQVHPVEFKPATWLINRCALWCDRRLKSDSLTLGWTVVARKPGLSVSG
jgi:SAM-dependent methyltransferase